MDRSEQFFSMKDKLMEEDGQVPFLWTLNITIHIIVVEEKRTEQEEDQT